jgi:GT2 family glycosyltransferase
MMDTPSSDARRLTAIVLNYRTPDLTIACVQSLLRSRGVDLDVLVVDNCSGDDSVARLREHCAGEPRVTILARDRNDGYAGGNNAGIVAVRQRGARYTLILNSDTVVDPDCVQRLVDDAERDPSIALVTPRIFFGDPPDRVWFGGGRFSLWTGRPVHVGYRGLAAASWSDARDLPFAPGCALLVRIAALGEVPLFDASLFSYIEDLDLSLRLRREGWRLRYVPDALVWHFEGTSHRRAGGQALRFYLNTRNLLRVAARYARWYHWVTLAPLLAVDVIGRYCMVAVRDRDPAVFAAVVRGVWHSVAGGKHPIEIPPSTNAVSVSRLSET